MWGGEAPGSKFSHGSAMAWELEAEFEDIIPPIFNNATKGGRAKGGMHRSGGSSGRPVGKRAIGGGGGECGTIGAGVEADGGLAGLGLLGHGNISGTSPVLPPLPRHLQQPPRGKKSAKRERSWAGSGREPLLVQADEGVGDEDDETEDDDTGERRPRPKAQARNVVGYWTAPCQPAVRLSDGAVGHWDTETDTFWEATAGEGERCHQSAVRTVGPSPHEVSLLRGTFDERAGINSTTGTVLFYDFLPPAGAPTVVCVALGLFGGTTPCPLVSCGCLLGLDMDHVGVLITEDALPTGVRPPTLALEATGALSPTCGDGDGMGGMPANTLLYLHVHLRATVPAVASRLCGLGHGVWLARRGDPDAPIATMRVQGSSFKWVRDDKAEKRLSQCVDNVPGMVRPEGVRGALGADTATGLARWKPAPPTMAAPFTRSSDVQHGCEITATGAANPDGCPESQPYARAGSLGTTEPVAMATSAPSLSWSGLVYDDSMAVSRDIMCWGAFSAWVCRRWLAGRAREPWPELGQICQPLASYAAALFHLHTCRTTGDTPSPGQFLAFNTPQKMSQAQVLHATALFYWASIHADDSTRLLTRADARTGLELYLRFGYVVLRKRAYHVKTQADKASKKTQQLV